MTVSTFRKSDFRPGTSQLRGSPHTFALQMALDGERREALGERLRDLRGAMPQRKIADRIDVTERTYGAWERGESGIQWEHLEDLAEFFKVSTNYLLFGSETRPANVGSQLDRIEANTAEILRLLKGADDVVAELEALPGRVEGAAGKPRRRASGRSAKS